MLYDIVNQTKVFEKRKSYGDKFKMIETNLKKTSAIVLTAMMMCIIMVAIFILRVPIPFTQGYVNLSDGIIFITIALLDKKHSIAAASLGSMMGDILGGFPVWANFMIAITDEVKAAMKGELAAREKRIAKYTEKYTADNKKRGAL